MLSPIQLRETGKCDGLVWGMRKGSRSRKEAKCKNPIQRVNPNSRPARTRNGIKPGNPKYTKNMNQENTINKNKRNYTKNTTKGLGNVGGGLGENSEG